MKNKLKAILLGVFVAVFSVFSLCSCGLVKPDNSKKNTGNAMQVGETVLTKNDIINQFYTYYQNNSNYFAYYDHETVVNSFYTWVAMRQIVSQNSSAMLYDETKNPNGYIVYTEEDEEDVWKSVKEYFYSQVSVYEKALYSLKGYEEDGYPVWLKDDKASDDNVKFEAYKTVKPEIKSRTEKLETKTEKLSEENVKKELGHVQEYLFEYVTETDDEGNEIREKIVYDGYIENSRNQAYTRYVEWLISSAKSSGTNTDAKVVLENEILRVYNSYYESKITTLFQNFYLQEYLTNYYGIEIGSEDDGKLGDTETLSDKALVKAFLDKYYQDMQTNQVESSFISTITSSDGASLVLYNYNGQNFFFTVQHILIKFDEYLEGQIKQLEGYASGSGTDYDKVIADYYRAEREKLTLGYKMLAEVKKDNYLEQSIIAGFVSGVVKPYYFDETINDKTGKGYIELKSDNATPSNIFDYENIEYYYIKDGEKQVVDSSEIKWLASESDIESIYKTAYSTLSADFIKYYDALVANNETEINALKEKYENMSYILETVENIKETYADDTAGAKALINRKVASFAFVELEFIFSADGLKNELSSKIGYVMSNYPDENGSWVVDFARGARDIISNLVGSSKNGNDVNVAIKNKLESGDVESLTNVIISDYGYHFIKVEDVYVQGESLVDVQNLSYDDVEEIVKLMKKTYVCSASNQTVYDYFYDSLYSALAGNSSSNGTYFLKLEYEWLNKYYEEGKIIYEEKLTYEQLMDSIS